MGDRFIVLYDMDCSLCQRAKERLESVDKTRRLQFLPLQDPDVPKRFPTLRRVDLVRTMHGVTADGKIVTGAKAYQEIGKRISPRSPLGMALKGYALITRFPGMLWIAEQVYQQIAQNRHKLGKNPSCPVPTQPPSVDDR